MTQPRRPDPQPLQTRDTPTILVGTGLWAAALLVVLLVVQPTDGRPIWTCVVGIGLGVFGLLYVRRRDSRRRDAAE
ncbi:DUF2530 domain-containing protein [Sphaerimonospora mesophila]|uniref:DUF2530 domain-containing protein n=1 Tax=Sphaerimonospora mesophila TaxID=37483 RepID=UPI001F1DA7E3